MNVTVNASKRDTYLMFSTFSQLLSARRYLQFLQITFGNVDSIPGLVQRFLTYITMVN